MRSMNRITPIMRLIEYIWRSNPDLRLCQLIGNCWGGNNYQKEDDELEQKLKEVYIKG